MASSPAGAAQRPTSVTVFGILNIALGLLGFVSTLFSLLVWVGGMADDNPILSAATVEGPYATWIQVSTVLGIVASLVLAAAGVGLLRMKPWGRLVSVGYSWYALVMVVIGTLMSWVYFLSPMLEEFRSTQDPEQQGALIGGLAGGLGGACFGLIYPLALLYFMTRPGLVVALGGSGAPPDPSTRPVHSGMGTVTAAGSPAAAVAVSAAAGLDDGAERNPYAPPTAPLRTSAVPGADRSEELLATIVPVRNKPALMSYYVGLFSLAALIPLFGVVGLVMAAFAIVQGLKGRRLANEHPEAKGKVHAWVGILCGALWGFLGLLVQIGIVVALLS